MYVKVRTMDGKQEAILTTSKLTEVEDLKVIFSVYMKRRVLFKIERESEGFINNPCSYLSCYCRFYCRSVFGT